MSGPKVVRVISREELVAQGETVLRRLDAALAQWERDCTAIGVGADEQKASRDRRDTLEQALRADRFVDFGRAAIAEIDFLEIDGSKRREKASHARAQERLRLENGRQVAAALLRRVEPIAPITRRELERAAAGGLSLAELDGVLISARQEVVKVKMPELSVQQRALAARLGATQKSESLEDWKAKFVASNHQLQAMFSHLSELELLGEAEQAKVLSAHLAEATSSSDESSRQMRLDTLLMAVKKAKLDAVAHLALRRKAKVLETELAAAQADESLRSSLRTAETQSNFSELPGLVAQAEQKLAELKVAHAATARRRAVLDGLSKLGYQVNEELSTATATGGRLVMRNPAVAGYGVELVPSSGGEQVQVRAVAFEPTRDTSQDIPAEQRWCDDFGALQVALKAQGCSVVIEKSSPVGAFPLRVLALPKDDERRPETALPKVRAGKS
jgi:hypothetical protein